MASPGAVEQTVVGQVWIAVEATIAGVVEFGSEFVDEEFAVAKAAVVPALAERSTAVGWLQPFAESSPELSPNLAESVGPVERPG